MNVCFMILLYSMCFTIFFDSFFCIISSFSHKNIFRKKNFVLIFFRCNNWASLNKHALTSKSYFCWFFHFLIFFAFLQILQNESSVFAFHLFRKKNMLPLCMKHSIVYNDITKKNSNNCLFAASSLLSSFSFSSCFFLNSSVENKYKYFLAFFFPFYSPKKKIICRDFRFFSSYLNVHNSSTLLQPTKKLFMRKCKKNCLLFFLPVCSNQLNLLSSTSPFLYTSFLSLFFSSLSSSKPSLFASNFLLSIIPLRYYDGLFAHYFFSLRKFQKIVISSSLSLFSLSFYTTQQQHLFKKFINFNCRKNLFFFFKSWRIRGINTSEKK